MFCRSVSRFLLLSLTSPYNLPLPLRYAAAGAQTATSSPLLRQPALALCKEHLLYRTPWEAVRRTKRAILAASLSDLESSTIESRVSGESELPPIGEGGFFADEGDASSLEDLPPHPASAEAGMPPSPAGSRPLLQLDEDYLSRNGPSAMRGPRGSSPPSGGGEEHGGPPHHLTTDRLSQWVTALYTVFEKEVRQQEMRLCLERRKVGGGSVGAVQAIPIGVFCARLAEQARIAASASSAPSGGDFCKTQSGGSCDPRFAVSSSFLSSQGRDAEDSYSSDEAPPLVNERDPPVLASHATLPPEAQTLIAACLTKPVFVAQLNLAYPGREPEAEDLALLLTPGGVLRELARLGELAAQKYEALRVERALGMIKRQFLTALEDALARSYCWLCPVDLLEVCVSWERNSRAQDRFLVQTGLV